MSKYDYRTNGADWPYLVADEANGEVNYCKTDTLNQSPINLMRPRGSYGWAYGLPISKDKDSITKSYQNMRKDIQLTWAKNTMKVKVHPTEVENNFFNSHLAEHMFGAKSMRFEAAQFHWHSPSEHTIDGKHFDLEIHVVHTQKMNATEDEDGNPIDPGKIKYAVIGLMFSVNDYDKSITARGN